MREMEEERGNEARRGGDRRKQTEGIREREGEKDGSCQREWGREKGREEESEWVTDRLSGRDVPELTPAHPTCCWSLFLCWNTCTRYWVREQSLHRCHVYPIHAPCNHNNNNIWFTWITKLFVLKFDTTEQTIYMKIVLKKCNTVFIHIVKNILFRFLL